MILYVLMCVFARQLLVKCFRALKPSGKLFVHIFAHWSTPYDFEGGWMTEHFISRGTMSSADLLLYFQDDLRAKRQRWVSGMHYSKTCGGWLTTMFEKQREYLEGVGGNLWGGRGVEVVE